MSRELRLSVIELSALRISELDDLVRTAASEDLSDFEYVAIHPDTIGDYALWRALESLLYVENMDKRKGIGRTVEELEDVLSRLPNAQVCFDIAHARQVDSSMTEAYRLLRHFRSRIRHIHFSEVATNSRHGQVSDSALRAYVQVASSIPYFVPVILESVVGDSEAPLADAVSELGRVARFFADSERLQATRTIRLVS